MPGAETLSRRLVSDEARKGSRSHSMLINFTGNGHPRDELQVLSIHGPVKHSSWVNSHDFKLPGIESGWFSVAEVAQADLISRWDRVPGLPEPSTVSMSR